MACLSSTVYSQLVARTFHKFLGMCAQVGFSRFILKIYIS